MTPDDRRCVLCGKPQPEPTEDPFVTGPEHYREAERLVSEALSETFVGYGRENHLAAAQVHATLALAASVRGGGRS